VHDSLKIEDRFIRAWESYCENSFPSAAAALPQVIIATKVAGAMPGMDRSYIVANRWA
jgi:hypothetical protein